MVTIQLVIYVEVFIIFSFYRRHLITISIIQHNLCHVIVLIFLLDVDNFFLDDAFLAKNILNMYQHVNNVNNIRINVVY